MDVSIEADESTAVVVVILLSCDEISLLFIDRGMELNKLLLEVAVKDGVVGQSLLHTCMGKVGRKDGVVGGDFVEVPRRYQYFKEFIIFVRFNKSWYIKSDHRYLYLPKDFLFWLLPDLAFFFVFLLSDNSFPPFVLSFADLNGNEGFESLRTPSFVDTSFLLFSSVGMLNRCCNTGESVISIVELFSKASGLLLIDCGAALVAGFWLRLGYWYELTFLDVIDCRPKEDVGKCDNPSGSGDGIGDGVGTRPKAEGEYPEANIEYGDKAATALKPRDGFPDAAARLAAYLSNCALYKESASKL